MSNVCAGLLITKDGQRKKTPVRLRFFICTVGMKHAKEKGFLKCLLGLQTLMPTPLQLRCVALSMKNIQENDSLSRAIERNLKTVFPFCLLMSPIRCSKSKNFLLLCNCRSACISSLSATALFGNCATTQFERICHRYLSSVL